MINISNNTLIFGIISEKEKPLIFKEGKLEGIFGFEVRLKI